MKTPEVSINIPVETLLATGMSKEDAECFSKAVNIPIFRTCIGSFGLKMKWEGTKSGFIAGVLVTGVVALAATLL